MDRDKRWERVKTAIDGLVRGEGEAAEDAVKAIEERYAKDETDEFLKPNILNGEDGRIKGRSRYYIQKLERTPNFYHRRRYSFLFQLPLGSYA